MSYVLTAYLVDLPDLRSVVGSKDQSLLKAVEPIIAEAYEDDEEDAEAMQAAARALIMGEPLDPEIAANYGWAFWQICKVKGEELLPDAWGGIRWDSVEASGLEDLLTKVGPPIPLPPLTDIPSIGYVPRDKVAAYIQAAEESKEKVDVNVVDLLDEYIEWLELAQSKNKDIVFFYG